MSETLALSRMALVRSRWLLLAMVVTVVIGVVTALLAGSIDPQAGASNLTVLALLFTLLPAAIASIVLFGYGEEGDISLVESGCSHWLLRMPIHAWKVAIVPVTLKTLWVSMLWTLFVYTTRYLGADEDIPILLPSICFSAAAIWVLVIAWRPFRSGWRRLSAMAVVAPVLYCCVSAVLVAPTLKQAEWRPLAITASAVAAAVVYLAAVWVAIRSVELARTCTLGVIPEFGKNVRSESSSTSEDRVRHFSSPLRALAWHDLLRSRIWIQKTLLFGVIPSIVGFSLFVPLRVDSVVITLVAFAYLAGIAICRTETYMVSTIPPYITASPLSTAIIAWTRCVIPMVVATGIFFCVLFVYAGWACWPENRDTWFAWAAERAGSLGRSAEAVSIGVRWSIAIVVASATFGLGRIASFMWIGMAGRAWLGVAMSLIAGLAVLAPLGIGIRWFLLQTDWESTKASAISYLALAPYLVGAILAVKALAVTATAVALTRSKLATAGTTFRVIAMWIAITLTVSLALFILIPDPRATLVWCLAITAMTIPVARILLQPLALAWNRHR